MATIKKYTEQYCRGIEGQKIHSHITKGQKNAPSWSMLADSYVSKGNIVHKINL